MSSNKMMITEGAIILPVAISQINIKRNIMNLKETSIQSYTEALASKSPTPGGGAASALSAAQAASLLSMVCHLSLGREKEEENQILLKKILEQSENLRKISLELMDLDAQAFSVVAELYKLPKEQKDRQEKMEVSLQACTTVPLEVMSTSHMGLTLSHSLLEFCNPRVLSDLGMAGIFFLAAMESAWLNVSINLPLLQDEAFVQASREKGESFLSKKQKLAREIASTVASKLASASSQL